jgi:hypothetical protein
MRTVFSSRGRLFLLAFYLPRLILFTWLFCRAVLANRMSNAFVVKGFFFTKLLFAPGTNDFHAATSITLMVKRGHGPPMELKRGRGDIGYETFASPGSGKDRWRRCQWPWTDREPPKGTERQVYRRSLFDQDTALSLAGTNNSNEPT